MTMTFSRRQAIAGALLAVPAVSALAGSAGAATGGVLEKRLADLEARHKGRIGVAIHNLATGVRVGHRADERFLMCSTFKALLAAHILARVDRKEEALDRRIVVKKSDLSEWSPVVEKRVGGNGISIAELCEAAVTLSDNAPRNDKNAQMKPKFAQAAPKQQAPSQGAFGAALAEAMKRK